jgi:hypothetical protein
MINYLTNIAPEGETFLVVKQSAKAWPAFLPSKKMTAGAWYGNTAMFIIDRFIDGKPSASASNCEHVGFMVLDDIGTKSTIPPLEPTWKMETSPNNYQWGYTFALDGQPTKGDFSAAIKAIADAGFTDGGAINPVRNFRLPGSINLKPGRDNFASVLTEFHPEREFTLDQICTALDVVPEAADTSTLNRIDIADDGTDEVLAWLKSAGYLLAEGNSAGWWGVLCPNHAEHSDGNPEGRYMPVTRAYTCLHEHCSEWDSHKFLQWVEQESGIKCGHGLRDELLAAVMETALSKLTPSDMFKTDALAEVERKELGRIERAKWFERFAYIQDDESYFDLQDRREVSRATFNALFRHVECKSIHTGRRVEASVFFDENRQSMGAKALVGITYAAGDSVLVTRDGDVYGNRWRDARPVCTPGNIAPWLTHCENLIPDAESRNHIFDVMAFKLQNPRIKVNHAILLGGTDGCGKDTVFAPFIHAVCGNGLKNRGLMDSDSATSQWGYQLESEIVIINELKEPDAGARRVLANKLKPIIAAPPEMLPINRKGLHPYMMCNRLLVLAFTNDYIPISLPTADRRWMCVWTHAPKMTPDDGAKMWQWFNAGGFSAIGAWLHARNVAHFKAGAPPPMTEYKLSLVEHGMSASESHIVEMLRLRVGEFQSGVIGSPFQSLCDRLATGLNSKVPPSALMHALVEAGWVDCGRLSSGDYTTKKHVFKAPGVDASKSELRRMCEPMISKLRAV